MKTLSFILTQIQLTDHKNLLLVKNFIYFVDLVIRDLSWLLNSVALDVCVDLDLYPEVQK